MNIDWELLFKGISAVSSIIILMLGMKIQVQLSLRSRTMDILETTWHRVVSLEFPIKDKRNGSENWIDYSKYMEFITQNKIFYSSRLYISLYDFGQQYNKINNAQLKSMDTDKISERLDISRNYIEKEIKNMLGIQNKKIRFSDIIDNYREWRLQKDLDKFS